MSLKQLVNTPAIYDAFIEHLEAETEKHYKNLENMSDTVLIYRTQGALQTLKRLKQLRETVNGKHS